VSALEILTLNEADLGRVRLFCGLSPTYRRGYQAKLDWTAARIREGMRYTLGRAGGHNAGMLEAIPGEAAWRGVAADGYLFIHCLWVIGRNRKHGYGQQLLHACLEQAAGMKGVAVVVSKAHWLPTPRFFAKNGFELADRAAPCFDLLARRFDPQTALPRFSPARQAPPPGLTFYHSDQCPYTQNTAAIVSQVGEHFGLPVNILRIESARAAQAAPCPYGTLGYFLDGELLSHRPLGSEELIALLEPKLVGRQMEAK